jgi:glycosyltransferase involved in cell wall biosynthesis
MDSSDGRACRQHTSAAEIFCYLRAAVALRGITLIAPHQRSASGGVHVIEQLARHLSPQLDVSLAVRHGPTHAIDGVRVVEAPRLQAGELPDADVLVGGLAQPDAERVLELPESKGTTVFLLQGYGTPGNARVTAMLARRPRVMAVSGFLVERASAHGCQVELIRPGLDRAIFRAGESCARRPPAVAMMTHATDWKASEDGLAALAAVRAAMPETELLLFGASGPRAEELGARHLGRLSPTEVAALLRHVSVFVCPSLEEGLGLPGIEALASGAALASTDTKGCRDYAIDGETALLSPPSSPELLAKSVIRLLSEPRLRERLATRGREQVRASYPSWPRAGEDFVRAIVKLIGRDRPPMALRSP